MVAAALPGTWQHLVRATLEEAADHRVVVRLRVCGASATTNLGDDIIPAMSTQWSYAGLTIMSTSNAQNDDYAHHAASVALLTDARGIRVLAVWDPDPMTPQLLYAVMDEAGKEGWIAGEPSSIQFEPQGPMQGKPVRIMDRPSVPAWIKVAVQNVEGLGEWSRGYCHYPLRRTHD